MSDETTGAPMVPAEFNLLEIETFAKGHPWALYDEMQRKGRLLRHPGGGDIGDFWVATHHEDIRAISHNTEQFSSMQGFNLPAGGRRAPPEIANAVGRNILGFDLPEHAEFKRILIPAFMPARIRALEERTHRFVVNLLDSLDGQREVEFVRQIAAVIPIKVLCDLLGVPLEDEERILHWTNLMVGVNDPDLSTGPAESFAAFMEVFAYGKWLVEKRRQEPQDDLMSMVAHGRLDGEPLDDRSRDGMCATLIAAGNETTRNAITASVQLMSKAPDERTRLVGDPALVGMAVEEFLRRATPLIHMMRTAKEDLEVAGQIIAKGEHVAMLYGAANHDPSVFPDPYHLDLGRPNARKHLAFGTGMHACIGQRVAQMEMRVLLRELLRRYPRAEALAEPTYMLSNFVCGIKKLPVRLH
ncbi:MAG: cytochrome P450 [Pseudomonadota bacterium]|nr:cytochrome P450 [Pseudomonadota bacterium]